MDTHGLRRSVAVICSLLVATLLPLAPAAAATESMPGSTTAGVVAAQGKVPFTPSACPIPAVEGVRIDCGYLTVAESRRNYTGKTIELAVAIMRSPNPTPAPDPMIFLAGGPGQGAISLAPIIPQAFGPTLAQRDIILIDQRGTGYSRPSLTCTYEFMTIKGNTPITASQESDRPAIIQSQVNSLIACGQAYRDAGIDLSAYNSVENAADLEDLRLSLGYGAWNVYGGSYGSRLALTAMQYRPETLRSVVLESVYPSQANFHTDVFASFSRSLDQLFSACAAETRCNEAYPNLGAAYDALIARLNASPVQVPILNPEDGTVITYLPVSGVDVGQIIFQLFYVTPAISVLPALIGETAAGNYELLGLLIGSLISGEQSGLLTFSLGMQVAVQCNEDATYANVEDFVSARDTNRRAAPLAHSVTFNEAILDVCAAWGLGTPEAGANAPISSDVRAFVIGGAFDPITPPDYSTEAMNTLPNATHVEYPRGGHTPSIGSPCLGAAVGAFFNNPASTPDTSCIAQEAPLPFLVPQ